MYIHVYKLCTNYLTVKLYCKAANTLFISMTFYYYFILLLKLYLHTVFSPGFNMQQTKLDKLQK